jgi:excisionase family DNA binding protein
MARQEGRNRLMPPIRKVRPLTPDILRNRLMLRVQEYAELTGTPLPSVYRYLALGKLRGIRIGGTLRIPVATVLEQMREPAGE